MQVFIHEQKLACALDSQILQVLIGGLFECCFEECGKISAGNVELFAKFGDVEGSVQVVLHIGYRGVDDGFGSSGRAGGICLKFFGAFLQSMKTHLLYLQGKQVFIFFVRSFLQLSEHFQKIRNIGFFKVKYGILVEKAALFK